MTNTMEKPTITIQYLHLVDGRVVLDFTNNTNGMIHCKVYKNKSAAKAAATRLTNRATSLITTEQH